MRVQKIPVLLSAILLMGLAIGAAPASGQACPMIEAGPIWSTVDAQTKCPQTCEPYGSWNGEWLTTVFGEMSVCQCCLTGPAVVPIEAGPLWSTADAQVKCPGICSPHGSWNGEWRTTVWNQMSVCDCQVPAPPAGPWLATSQLSGYLFKVRINGSALGSQVADCVPETLCVAGAIPTRTELFLRIIGPRPDGFLWDQVVRFTTSRLEVWVQRLSTGQLNYYNLSAVPTDGDTLPGLVDKRSFVP